MKVGNLVQIFAYAPHDSELARTPLHTGIFIDYEYEEPDGGWKVLTEGKIETFTKTWWKCREIEDGNR